MPITAFIGVRISWLIVGEELALRLRRRLGLLARLLELGDVVVDAEEADALAVDGERHEHQLHVDRRAVLPLSARDPLRATRSRAPRA